MIAINSMHLLLGLSTFNNVRSFGQVAFQSPKQPEIMFVNSQQRQLLRPLQALPDKGDLYDPNELMDLLSLHQALNDEEPGDIDESQLPPKDEMAIPAIHDLVLQTLDDIDSSPQTYNVGIVEEQSSHLDDSMNTLMTLLRDKKPSIRAIASDVDGTLLSSGQELHPLTLDAVLRAIDQSQSSGDNNRNGEGESKIRHFFAATGKSRAGAASSLGPILGPLLYQCPGVYIQGLYCVDGKNNVLFEKKLPPSAIQAAEDLIAEYGISIIGYDGDNLYSTELTEEVVELSEFYGEPTVQLISQTEGVMNLVKHQNGMHKLLLMDRDVDKLSNVIRPRLEELAIEHDATVTQAIPTMLELLPKGCSKAYGVEKVCESLGIDPGTELLALGDAENDVGMLQMASIGVAVGNACSKARDAADFIMRERNDEGGAGLAMGLFGFDD